MAAGAKTMDCAYSGTTKLHRLEETSEQKALH